METAKIFISYAHDDNPYFKIFVDTLKRVLKSSKSFKWYIWDDRKINIGENWHEIIQDNVKKSDIAILLISDSFLASDYIEKNEFKNFIERYNNEGVYIAPIFFAPCTFTNWSELAKKQMFMPSGKEYDKGYVRDFSFADLVKFRDRDGELIPNPNISRYVNNFVQALEKGYGKYLNEKTNQRKTNQQTIKPQEITKIPYFNIQKNLVDRQGFINKIHDELLKKENLVVIYGVPGIGKSTIALAYINNPDLMKDFNHIAWVSIVGDIKVDLTQNLSGKKSGYGYNPDLNIEENFDILINELRDLEGNNLLILDNVNDTKQFLRIKDDLLRSKFNILITSRSNIKYVKSLSIDELSDEHAKELFYKYFQKENNNTILNKLLKVTGKHTLLIELLAKVGNENPFLDNIDELYQKYKTEGLDADDLNVQIPIGNKEETLFKHISHLFDEKDLSEDENKYLRYFSVLPSTEIEVQTLIELFNIPNSKKYEFVKTLNAIAKKGWLISSNSKQFKCHQFTQTILRYELKPNTENCKDLLSNLLNKIYYREGFTEHYLSKLPYLVFAEHVWLFFSHKERIILEIADEIVYSYKNVGEYKKILALQKEIIRIKEEYFSNDSIFIAVSKNSMAMIYRGLGSYNIALKLAKEAVSLVSENDNKQYLLDISTYYNNYGLMLRHFRKDKEAEKQYLKSIRILENLKDNNYNSKINVNLSLAFRYNNLAFIYRDLGDHTKEMEYHRESVDLREKYYNDPNHPKLAVAYSNLGASLIDDNQLEEAKKYLDKSFKIKKENYGEDSLFMFFLYRNFAKYYLKKEEYLKAASFIEKSIDIQTEKTNSNHPRLMEMYKIKSDIALAENKIIQAVSDLRKAIDIGTRNFSDEHTTLKEYKLQMELLKNRL